MHTIVSLKDDGVDPALIGVLGAAIGALFTFVPMFIMHKLENKRQKIKYLKELLSQEKSVSVEIIENIGQLVEGQVESKGWYAGRTLEGHASNPEWQQFYYVRSQEVASRTVEFKSDVLQLKAKYIQVVSLYLLIAEKQLIPALSEFENYKLKEVHDLPPVKTFNELTAAMKKEKERLLESYRDLEGIFAGIRDEMVQ